ncbi:MAG: CatB-related O-acetyltransferase [Defluviitaleaceae bacterium]|nr:CatB-related O-acetyltransferase [Defluviitaleaceae bacterium]
MKTRLDQVLERCLGGRTVAVWGNPTRSLGRALKDYGYITADRVDKTKHFVVAVTEDDFDDFRSDPQSGPFAFPLDCLTFEDPGGELPFEWECRGVKIGRQTYFGESVAAACEEGYVKKIGHFTSINGSAKIAVNHQLGMTFVGDDIDYFFNAENKRKFRELIQNDPKHPYAQGKEAISIGSDVYIGANSFINASRVKSIGDGAIIGTGAVVLADVPPYAVYAGVPAKLMRYRFPIEMVDLLLRVKWWEWDEETINKNADALFSPAVFYERFKNYDPDSPA